MTAGDRTPEPDGDLDGGAGAGLGDDPRVQAGLDHLQRAAREVIAATRALLDVAEELVEDPKAAAGLADLIGSVTDLRSRRTAVVDVHGVDPDDEPPVQRIPVS